MVEKRFSRRCFFYGSLLAGAAPSGGFGSTPGLSALGYKSLTERLNIAAVGVGLRGNHILQGAAVTENIVALCDVDDDRLARASQTYTKAAKYKDFRQMLDKDGETIDAVMVAVPDHVHTPISLLCMQHGKPVYCEKPLTHTVPEVRLLADAAAKYKVAMQMGNQGFSHEGTKTACEIVWSGEIGDVREVHAWTGAVTGGRLDVSEAGLARTACPGDVRLGPLAGAGGRTPIQSAYPQELAPVPRLLAGWTDGRLAGPYHGPGASRAATRFGFPDQRRMRQQGTHKPAALAMARPHSIRIPPARGYAAGDRPLVPEHARRLQESAGYGGKRSALAALEQPDRKGPAVPGRRRWRYGGGRPSDGSRHAGDRARRDAGRRAAGRGQAGGRASRQPVDPALRAPGNGTVFVSSKGCMATSGRGKRVWLLPASRWADYKLPPQLIPRGANHQQDWIRACKGGTPGVSQFSVTAKYLEWLALGTVAQEVPGKLLWDAKSMRFSNNAEANKYLTPFVRKGWETKL